MDLLPCLLLATVCAAAEPLPLLAPPFSDHAVLQRGRPVAVWGWAAPGQAVEVELAGAPGAARATVAAGTDGRWQAALGPFAAGGPFALQARAGASQAAARDVLVGEVWLCSGQSNMEMLVKDAADPAGEAARAPGDQVRHLLVRRNRALERQAVAPCAWEPATPERVGGFSAVAYFLGRELQQRLQVPVGVVASSWGGTGIEYWMSPESLAALPDLAPHLTAFHKRARRYLDQSAATGKDFPELAAAWLATHDPGSSATSGWADPALPDADWSAAEMPGLLADRGLARPERQGVTWLRRTIELPAELAGRPGFVRLGRLNDYDTTWINGTEVGRCEWPSGERGYQVRAGVLRAGANVVAVRLVTTASRAGFASEPAALRLNVQGRTEPLPLAGSWRVRLGADQAGAPPYPISFDHVGGFSIMHLGMIAPIQPMSLAGVAWYQGESNAQGGHRYRGRLSALIADWRAGFARDDLPFLVVSLANHRARAAQPGESNWADLREDQAQTVLTTPRCGLAVAIDVGEERDIHPKDKQTVGRRLALAARAIAYGEAVEWSGPWYRAMAVEGGAIRLSFDHLGGGLTASDGKPLTGFSIAGEDRAFVWAEARIDGDSVLVSSPAVARPVAVRYAWADNPACNLANQAGLPAVPFRTDDWPRPAAAKP
ncbi:MAG: hypothetical protein L6R48_00865 [Planctomycetes bacterium]|nr:hypothetical protein [Planctomycetota bacterium]